MPRIDPLQLLSCLQVLLSPNGGILSKNEVHRLASLMTKFSKKLVSKCVYVLILKNTEVTLLGLFMAAGGWTLIHLWLHDAIYTMNWALVKELLELLLITPVDVERLKSNNIPKLVKSLSKREDLHGVHELSNQLVQQWLKIVKDETQYELASQQKTVNTVVVPEDATVNADIDAESAQTEQTGEEDVVDCEEFDSGINSQTFYKLTLKDGKHLISKVGAADTNFQVLENVEVVEMKDEEEVKDKDSKAEEKKKLHDKSKHKSSSSSKSSNSSSSSSSSRDKDKSSHRDRDKSKHSSSSKDKDRSRDKHKHDKSKDKDRHKSNGSVSKSSSKSSSSSSSKDKDKEKDKEKKDSKEKQAEKDKDTLSKIQPHTSQKLPKIPKKSSDEKDKSKKDEPKKGSISVEVRKTNEERPKTVKVYKSKMRSTGLEEEAKPAPPRPTKKPGPTPIVPPPPPPVPSLKRPSPIRDLNSVPPEKKTKIEPLEKPGSIKLIPPKPKPAVLQESDMFMDALTASATTKKEPKKRKRRASVSKDSTGTSPPPSPSSKEPSASFKNLSPPKFYQDTLDAEEKPESSENSKTTDNEHTPPEPDDTTEIPDRIPTPTDNSPEIEEELPRTKNENGLKGVLVYVRRKGPKKSIKWKPDEELVDIQYFELDETERVNVTKTFGDMAKMDVRGEREALQMSRKLQNEDVMDVHTMWRIPFEIDLPELLAEPGCKSLEKDIQFAREKSVLQAIYFNKKMLPETPAEPDSEMYQVKDPIVIPVDAADNPDHDFRDTPWPEPKGSPPPPNISNNVSAMFPNVQGPFPNFQMGTGPNFQNMQNIPNVQPFQGPPFMQQNVMSGGEWNNGNVPPNVHNPQMMPRNMPPPEMMNQGMINPNMFIPPQENFNPMMNENNHRFPMPFNQQGPGMFPNNFNRGGFRRGGGNGPWLRMNVPQPNNWNMRNGSGPHRGGGRMCHHFRNKGFCKHRDNCPFFHPNN